MMGNLAKVLAFRKPEETRHLIAEGLQDWEDQRLSRAPIQIHFTPEETKLETFRPQFLKTNKPKYGIGMDWIGTAVLLITIVLFFIFIYVNIARTLFNQ